MRNIIIKQRSRVLRVRVSIALNYLCICVIILLTSRSVMINIESVSNEILASRHSNCTVSFYTAAANQSFEKGEKKIDIRNFPYYYYYCYYYLII